MAELTLQDLDEGPVRVVRVAGRLDTLTVGEFDRHMEGVTASAIVLDLADLDYISSAGLRGILSVYKRSAAAGGRVVLAAPAPSVLEVLDISGFKALLPVHDDRAAALASLA